MSFLHTFTVQVGIDDLQLCEDRLMSGWGSKTSGMRWSTSGAQAMLSLRSLKASIAWDEFHKHFLNQSPLNA